MLGPDRKARLPLPCGPAAHFLNSAPASRARFQFAAPSDWRDLRFSRSVSDLPSQIVVSAQLARPPEALLAIDRSRSSEILECKRPREQDGKTLTPVI